MIEQLLNNWSQLCQGEWSLWPSCLDTAIIIWNQKYQKKWDPTFCSKSCYFSGRLDFHGAGIEAMNHDDLFTTFFDEFCDCVKKILKLFFREIVWCKTRIEARNKIVFVGKFPETQVTKQHFFVKLLEI